MSLWNTAQALGLRCKVVPIMRGSRVYEEEDPYRMDNDDEEEHDKRPYHLFQSKFQPFARGDMVTEDDEKDTWGHKLPENKVTWLKSNDNAWGETKKFGEVRQRTQR
jgi:hypothetical protein